MPINGVKSEFLMGRQVMVLWYLPELSWKASETPPPNSTPHPDTFAYKQSNNKDLKDFFKIKDAGICSVQPCCTIWCVFAGGKNEEFKIRGAINTNFPEVVLGNLSSLPTSSRPENRQSTGIFTVLSGEKFPSYPLKKWSWIWSKWKHCEITCFLPKFVFFFLISCKISATH